MIMIHCHVSMAFIILKPLIMGHLYIRIKVSNMVHVPTKEGHIYGSIVPKLLII